MNKIMPLFDEEYVKDFFRREILPLYPIYSDIESVSIRPYKKMIWTDTYHVVIGYKISFIKSAGEIERKLIVCSAHSEEPRENVYKAMDYLWRSGFNDGKIEMPRPLFYSPEFRGVFYRGLRGENILRYVKDKDFDRVEKKVILAAKLMARLHETPTKDWVELNPGSSEIISVIPGVETIKKEMSQRFFGRYDSDIAEAYDYFIKQEKEFLPHQGDLCLIHGDAHLENLIDTGDDGLGLIDFSDFCRADYARDLGSFLQQLEYKMLTKGNDPLRGEEFKRLFLHEYLAERKIIMTPELEKRISLYYNWTMIRTTTYLFLSHNNEPERAVELLKIAMENIRSNKVKI